MTKLKKQRKKKVYNYGRNRSRVRKQQERTTKFNVKVDCKAMKDNWDNRVTMKENMAAMGVALDANAVLPFAGTKKSLINKLKKQKKVPVAVVEKPEVTKPEVVSKLEAEANVEAKQNFRFTTTQVQLITYMMDKHGMDFSAMSRDPKNHYQETTAKLKGMVTRFISIPEHYAPYCKERGLIKPSEKKMSQKKMKSLKRKSLKWLKTKKILMIQMMDQVLTKKGIRI
eukprot:TRINITY_DN2855_c0_g1_i1.p1 TRINITY_DN2855_c0_g1~~TRINITY_DN2855_c0_g1_i1.p1  ORF type:complete len:227 (+),score=98.28 TRINITY_DN2855_c0_g1_i1:113-793(+)